MARGVKGNKKGFWKYISENRKNKEKVGPLLKEMADLGSKTWRSLRYSANFLYWSSPAEVTKTEEKHKENEVPPTIEEDQIHDLQRHLNEHKSMGPDVIHPQVQRELAGEVVKLLTIILEKLWQAT